jgi:hypothetical protein
VSTYAIEAARIHARPTRLTRLADPRHPLYPHTIAELDSCVLGSRSHLDDLAHALVASHLTCLCGEGERLPGVEHHAHVRVADAGVGAAKCQYGLSQAIVDSGEWEILGMRERRTD